MNTIYNTMVYIVWFFATYYMVFIILSLFTYRKELFHNNKILKREPFVTFIIPAFNEEADVLDTIKSLKKLE